MTAPWSPAARALMAWVDSEPSSWGWEGHETAPGTDAEARRDADAETRKPIRTQETRKRA